MWRETIRHARLDLVFYGARPPLQDIECLVRVDDTGVIVEAPAVALHAHGIRISPGHFMMMASDGSIGSLHRYPGGRAFEGWWQRRGERGFWRIHPASRQES